MFVCYFKAASQTMVIDRTIGQLRFSLSCDSFSDLIEKSHIIICDLFISLFAEHFMDTRMSAVMSLTLSAFCHTQLGYGLLGCVFTKTWRLYKASLGSDWPWQHFVVIPYGCKQAEPTWVFIVVGAFLGIQKCFSSWARSWGMLEYVQALLHSELSFYRVEPSFIFFMHSVNVWILFEACLIF